MSATPRRLASLVAALTLASAPAAFADSGLECANNHYGTSCIQITGSDLEVQDIEAWFVPPNRNYMGRDRWAIALERYRCNPIGKTFDECPFKKQWTTKPQRGEAKRDGQTCEMIAPEGIGYQDCYDHGVVYRDAARRHFRHFYTLSHTFGHSVWFCTELVFRIDGQWIRNGAADSKGLRSCAEVHD